MTAKVDTGDLGPSSGATGANSEIPEGAVAEGREEESKIVGSSANADDVMNLGTSPNDAPSPGGASRKLQSSHCVTDCFA